MAVQVNKVYQIVIAITIQVQAVDGVGVQVGGIVGRDESAPLRGVIPGITVVEAGVMVEAVVIVTNMGGFAASISAYLFYHLPCPQSRKSLPGRNDLGDFGEHMIITWYKSC